MKISKVKQEFQLQQWRRMVLERKESGLSVKEWCLERRITEHVYYYRLRLLRIATCQALQEAQPVERSRWYQGAPDRHASQQQKARRAEVLATPHNE